jgi:hypothetical protein
MIKRVTIFFMAFILCGAVGSAQDIPADKYKNVADYVIAYYVKAYIEKKTDNESRKTFQAEWQKLNENSFENPTSKSDLEAIINKLPAKKLEGSKNNEIIQEKTRNFYENIKNKRDKKASTIDRLVKLQSTYEKYLKDDGKLKQILKNKLSISQNVPEEGNEKAAGNQGEDNSKDAVKNPDENKQNEKSGSRTANGDDNNISQDKKYSSWWWFGLIAGLVGGIFCWGKCLRGKSLKNKTENSISAEFDALKKDYARLQENNKQLENQVRQLENQVEQLEDQHKSARFDGIITETKPTQISAYDNSSTLYAAAIIDGIFHNVKTTPNEDTVYEITKTLDRTATFRIYSDAYRRVIKNPDFIDGCDKQRISHTQTTLEIEDGEATQDDFGRWKIIKKAKIKFI